MIKSVTIAKRAMAYYFRYREHEQAKARMIEDGQQLNHQAAVEILFKQRREAYGALLRVCAMVAQDYPEDDEQG